MAFGTIMILFGTGVASIGAVMLLAGDLMWTAQEMDNASEGLVSKRSGLWDAKRTFTGFCLILAGLVFVIAGFGMRSGDDGDSGNHCIDVACMTVTPSATDARSPLWPAQVEATASPVFEGESGTP